MRFVIFGAGAVGGVIGGFLALDKHPVLLICREDHARAIDSQRGLKMKSATSELFAPLEAETATIPSHFDSDTCVFLIPKSNDTQTCVDELCRHAPPDTPIVCFQNGVDNEAIVSQKFENVFGGVCRMTCSYLHPGQVSYRKMGRLIVGRYPKGANATAKKIGKLLGSAGFSSSVSNDIMSDKWLKLVTNLHSAVNAVIDERDHESPEFIHLKIGLLEEAKRVLKAGRIKARSCDGKDSSVDEMIDELKKPHAPRQASAVRVHNSTWQNLYKKSGNVENEFFHGPIITLAKEHDIAVPHNEVILELVKQDARDKTDPGQHRAVDITEIVGKRGTSN